MELIIFVIGCVAVRFMWKMWCSTDNSSKSRNRTYPAYSAIANATGTTTQQSKPDSSRMTLESVRKLLIAQCAIDKLTQNMQDENRHKTRDYKADAIISCVRSSVSKLIQTNNSTLLEDEKHASITQHLIECIQSIEKIASCGIISNNSHWEHYTAALLDGDYDYVKLVNRDILEQIGSGASPELCMNVFKSFIHDAPLPKFNYKLRNNQTPYYKYYDTVISEIKRIDTKNVIDGLHWIELTEDDNIKKAFQDWIDPKQLAQHIVTYSKIPTS